jgi:regulator of protease activity HflC (stomatin/prohibitin superfamily)
MELLEAFPRLIGWAVPIIILVIIVFPQAIRILREYERGVIFRLGKLLGAKGPGIIFLIPIVDRMVRMDLRVVTISVEKQEVMTRDNVPVTVDAVVYFRVVDPQSAVVKVENFLKATSLMSQTTLRSVLGQAPLDDLLSQRESINQKLQEIIDREAGRSRARTPREDRQCRGRISSGGKNGAGCGDDEQGTDCAATALPANHARNLQRT